MTDISFETLAQVCSIDITQLTKSARGELNAALKQIRDALPDLADLELAIVIEDRGKAYRRAMPDVIVTPSALAKHWSALEGMQAERQAYPVYEPRGCKTCDDLRLVFVGYADGYEAWDPCPDCNAKALEIARQWRERFDRQHGRRRAVMPSSKPSPLIP